jgi:ferritin
MEVPKIKLKERNPFIPKETIDILNFRIEQEEYSSRIYHSMELYLNDKGFLGASKAFKKDSEDEMVHASWAKEYLLDMGIQPKTPALKEPPQAFEGLEDVLNKSYDHEVMVTKQCQDLASYAMKAANHMLYNLAMKYLKEQQEELGKAQTRLDRVALVAGNPVGLIMIDQELGDGNL